MKLSKKFSLMLLAGGIITTISAGAVLASQNNEPNVIEVKEVEQVEEEEVSDSGKIIYEDSDIIEYTDEKIVEITELP